MKDLAKLTFEFIDKPINFLVARFVDTSVVETSLPREKEFFLKDKENKDSIEYINTMIGAIHARATAAISHVSIMVGVTILLMARPETIPVIKFFMLLEIVFYCLILILCLRCIRSMTLNDGLAYEIDELADVYDKEIIHRFSVLQLINSGLVIATMIFLILIVAFGLFV